MGLNVCWTEGSDSKQSNIVKYLFFVVYFGLEAQYLPGNFATLANTHKPTQIPSFLCRRWDLPQARHRRNVSLLQPGAVCQRRSSVFGLKTKWTRIRWYRPSSQSATCLAEGRVNTGCPLAGHRVRLNQFLFRGSDQHHTQ